MGTLLKTRGTVLLIGVMLIGVIFGVVTAQPGGPPDSDDDGLPDTVDNCPNRAGPRSNGGCPLPTGDDDPEDTRTDGDRDGDGTIDVFDVCPDAGGPNNNRGCPPDINPDDVLGSQDEPGTAPLPPLPDLLDEGRCTLSPAGQFFVRVREFASLAANQIATLSPQDVVVAAFAVQNDEGLWYKLVAPNGYVASTVVRLSETCDNLPRIEWTTHSALLGDSSLGSHIHLLSFLPAVQQPGDNLALMMFTNPGPPNEPNDQIIVILQPAPGAMPDSDDQIMMMFLHGGELFFNPQPDPPAPDSFFDIFVTDTFSPALMQVLGIAEEPVMMPMSGDANGFDPPSGFPIALFLLPVVQAEGNFDPNDEITLMLLPAIEPVDPSAPMIVMTGFLLPGDGSVMPLSMPFGDWLMESQGYIPFFGDDMMLLSAPIQTPEVTPEVSAPVQTPEVTPEVVPDPVQTPEVTPEVVPAPVQTPEVDPQVPDPVQTPEVLDPNISQGTFDPQGTPSSPPSGACTVSWTAGIERTFYRQPSILSAVFAMNNFAGEAAAHVRVLSLSSEDWIGFDPGIAQADNTGFERLRWLQFGEGVMLTGVGCENLSVYSVVE